MRIQDFVAVIATMPITDECPECLYPVLESDGKCDNCGTESDLTVPRDLQTILDDLIRQARRYERLAARDPAGGQGDERDQSTRDDEPRVYCARSSPGRD